MPCPSSNVCANNSSRHADFPSEDRARPVKRDGASEEVKPGSRTGDGGCGHESGRLASDRLGCAQRPSERRPATRGRVLRRPRTRLSAQRRRSLPGHPCTHTSHAVIQPGQVVQRPGPEPDRGAGPHVRRAPVAGRLRRHSRRHSWLGKLRSFAAGLDADLGEWLGRCLDGRGCLHRDSPLFPGRSGAVVVRSCWCAAVSGQAVRRGGVGRCLKDVAWLL